MTSLKDARIRTTIPPLTPRQREVLGLLVRGYSNPQIGEALGISLDGAKWHVAEIMTRLGVDSREEAAAYWRNYNRPAARLGRFARALVPAAAWAKWSAAVAGVGAVSAIAVVTVVAMNGGNAGTPPVSTASATTTASATNAASSTASAVAVVSSATATATPAGVVPTPSPTPPATRTGIRSVDNAIAAMEAQDFDALAQQLVTHPMQCGVTPSADDWAFDCPSDVPTGTSMAVYTTAGCDHPTYYPAGDAVASLAGQVSGRASIVGVAENPDGTYRAIFRDDDTNALTLTISDEGITVVGRACGVTPAAVLAASAPGSVIFPSTFVSPITGIEIVDRVLASMQAQDYSALASFLVTTPVRCGLNPPPDGDWLSPCAPGIATGTLQQVYLVGGCDSPTWQPAATAATTLAGMIDGTPRLYGVNRNPDDAAPNVAGTYNAIFQDDNESAFTLNVTSDGVTTVSRACGVPASAVLAAGGAVIVGPFE